MFAPYVGSADFTLAASNSGRTITPRKPAAGQSDQYRITPGETLDLSQIANESITLVKLGARLVVLFPDKSYVVVDGMYLPDGSPSPDVRVGLDSSTIVNGPQFVAQFPISSDEQILTAAGINTGPRGSGGINLAAGFQGSALQPLSGLTPDISQGSSELPELQESTFRAANGVGVGGTPPGLPTPVPQPPVAAADAAAVSEAGVNPGDTAFPGISTLSGSVTGNDTLNSPVTVTGVALGSVLLASGNVGAAVSGTYGRLTINANGSYSYTLDNADADTQALSQGMVVQEVYTYTITDGFGATSTATVTITITGTNDRPVVTGVDFSGAVAEAPESAGSEEGPSLPVPPSTASGLLAASDVDAGAILTWAGSATGSYGDFVITTGGSWTYTLDDTLANSLAEGQTITETFTATVTDEFGATSTQVVTITITGANDGPSLDLDTTAFGRNYFGVTEAEAARSTDTPSIANGVSIVQRDETNPLLPGFTAVSDPDTIDRFSRLDVRVNFASGDRGILMLDPAVAGALGAAITVSGDGTFTLNISSISGLTAAEVQTLLDGIRYVNTETTFALDISDRFIRVEIADMSGATASAFSLIPVSADVRDTTGLDAFTGTRFGDRIDGMDGNDVIDGRGGDNTILGGDGEDILMADDGDNIVHGDAGDDGILLGDGDNIVEGGDGDDGIILGDGNNIVRAGDGDDLILAGDGDNTIYGEDGDDEIATCLGDDQIWGGSGDDVIDACEGVNVVHGGDDDDSILSFGSADGTSQIYGDAGDDIILTGDNAHDIFGGLGDDVIIAGNVDDLITGGEGADEITTGDGADTLFFDDVATEGADTITDFTSGTDAVSFLASDLGGGLATGGADTGTLDASRFTSGTAFTNADQRFLFNTNDNVLYYDADGSGGAESAIALALFENGGTVTATDIRIT